MKVVIHASSGRTVYYQFKSKRGVLEALFDDLANRGLMPHLRPVFGEPEPARALEALIGASPRSGSQIASCCGGRARWRCSTPRLARRFVRATKCVAVTGARSWRASTKGGRLRRRPHRSTAVDALHMLTSFETFDTLRSIGHSHDNTVAIVRKLAAAALA